MYLVQWSLERESIFGSSFYKFYVYDLENKTTNELYNTTIAEIE